MPTALITGGTTGIGRATAELLHARGYHVAVTGQNPDSLAAARLGRLDLLFLNAGIVRPAPVGDVSEESFDDHVAVNFKASTSLCRRPPAFRIQP